MKEEEGGGREMGGKMGWTREGGGRGNDHEEKEVVWGGLGRRIMGWIRIEEEEVEWTRKKEEGVDEEMRRRKW